VDGLGKRLRRANDERGGKIGEGRGWEEEIGGVEGGKGCGKVIGERS